MHQALKTATLFAAAGGLIAAAVALSGPSIARAPDQPNQPDPVVTEQTRPRAQIALLLDTSGSMSGLIDQARSQLWKIVNEMAEAERDGQRPELEIALFEYGNDRLPGAEGYIRMISGFTRDLDGLSEKLFALTTNGGSEYCGEAIQSATRQLDWSKNPDDVKLMFIAGNEPFDQGSVAPSSAIFEAREKGIAINTIFCGNDGSHEVAGWHEGARLAGGKALSIDHNMKVAHVVAPQDDEIQRLGMKLNETYVPFGAHGATGSARQAAQDANADSAKQGSLLQRSVAKSSGSYYNAGWDLVDATQREGVKLEAVEEGHLPPAMRTMNVAERRAHVKKLASKRARLQKKIRKLNSEREAYVNAERAKAGDAVASTLDTAMLDLVRDAAKKKGYRF